MVTQRCRICPTATQTIVYKFFLILRNRQPPAASGCFGSAPLELLPTHARSRIVKELKAGVARVELDRSLTKITTLRLAMERQECDKVDVFFLYYRAGALF